MMEVSQSMCLHRAELAVLAQALELMKLCDITGMHFSEAVIVAACGQGKLSVSGFVWT